MVIGPLLRILTALAVGATGATFVYVASALFTPSGFADLRGAPLWLVGKYFAFAWLWSVAPTAAIGGLVWTPLHNSKRDGFVAYAAIAIVCACIGTLILAHQLPSLLVVFMVVANAILVRAAELMFVNDR